MTKNTKDTDVFSRIDDRKFKLIILMDYLFDNDMDLYEFDNGVALNTYFSLGGMLLGGKLLDKIEELHKQGYQGGTISLEMLAMGVDEMVSHYTDAFDNNPIEDVIHAMGNSEVLAVYWNLTRYAEMLEKDLGISFGDKVHEDLDTLCNIMTEEWDNPE